MTQMCMLHFTRHYIDILQEMLLSLMLFYGKFIKVYVCQKLLKYSLVWQTYGKNKKCAVFCITVYIKNRIAQYVIQNIVYGLYRHGRSSKPARTTWNETKIKYCFISCERRRQSFISVLFHMCEPLKSICAWHTYCADKVKSRVERVRS